MNPTILITAFAVAEFLSSYMEARPEGNSIVAFHDNQEYTFEGHEKALELALSTAKNESEKEGIKEDFNLFLEREDYLSELPETVTTEDEEEENEI